MTIDHTSARLTCARFYATNNKDLITYMVRFLRCYSMLMYTSNVAPLGTSCESMLLDT